MFELLTCNAAVLVIAATYYAWKDRTKKLFAKRQLLRERVSYMLWAVAQRAD